MADDHRSADSSRDAGDSALFAVKSWLRRKEVMHPDSENDADKS